MLYLPRLTVLVTIVANRPGAWFPGPLNPYITWFSAIYLSRDFKRAKVPGSPMNSPFCFGVFWGVIFKKKKIASKQPNHVKHLLSGLNKLLKGNFHLLRSPPGDLRVAHCSHFSVRILTPISLFFPLTGISARGPQGRSDTALRLDSRLFALYATWFPGICLISEGKTTNKTILLCPPSLIQRRIPTHPAVLPNFPTESIK
jgi:hypothetical protein